MEEESLIRDQLADKLSIIEPGLSLIKIEFHLPNSKGSKGFVDILATDVFGNYVIIEIKRSKATSRETIQEIIKYIGLLKLNFKAKDSEVRAIIISTQWDELFVPFCEFVYESTLHVKGFLLSLNASKKIATIDEVLPEIISQDRRQLAHTYKLAFFNFKEDRDIYLQKLAAISENIGLKDFVITCISIVGSSRVIHPFATCYSFNELTKKHYLSLPLIKKEMGMKEREFDSEVDFLSYIEQCVLCAICHDNRDYDSMEVGSPETFQSVLEVQGWKIDSVHRYGIFKTDPRLTDIMLIKELKGYNGSNNHLYSNFAESAHKDRLSEIIKKSVTPFDWNNEWQEQLKRLFKFIQNKSNSFRIVVHVYSPESIVYGIYSFLKFQRTDYLPMYLIFVDYTALNEVQIFEGGLSWNGEKINENAYRSFVNSNRNIFISKPVDICMGLFDEEILRHFNLEFTTTVTTKKQNQEENSNNIYLDVEGKLKINRTSTYLPMVNWVASHLHFCWGVIQMYEANVATLNN
ncbi:endonuclease NucS domain-containing protein [Mucilaginibacter sp. AW1-7]|uniref:endonuclease NucS domain-containing protein n=1 Tax=Mucilaginibacter sp. AW1-7 TaxID=3349874 RepID=UPI003F73B34C